MKDANKVQMRATKAGAQVIESNCDDKGGSLCILEGPEGIMITITTHDNMKSQAIHEVMMNAIRPKGDDDGGESDSDGFSSAPSASNKAITNPRPIIHTLDVSLVSTIHPKGYVTAPPNNRKPVAFETDVSEFSIFFHEIICTSTSPLPRNL